jgi:hypothetical protein
VQEVDSAHRVEYQLAHDEPAGVIGAVVDGFGVVCPRSNSAPDVSLFFADWVEYQTGYAKPGIRLPDVGQRPLTLAAAVTARDHHGGDLSFGIGWTIQDRGDAGSRFARPDPLFDDDPITLELSSGFGCEVASIGWDAEEGGQLRP